MIPRSDELRGIFSLCVMCCVTRLGAWLAPLQLSLLGVKSCLVRLVTYTQIKGRI